MRVAGDIERELELLRGYHAGVVTVGSEKAATDALTKHKWNLERAVDEFLTGASGKAGSKGPERKIDATKLNKIFDTYAGSESEARAPETQAA